MEDDNLLNIEQSQFDVILCLSITKWIHLNWGDNGIKRAFKRMFAQLRPGGKLILEPQNWTSYKSKKNLTVSITSTTTNTNTNTNKISLFLLQETMYKNYNSIELFPDNFTQYLLSPEIGFAKSEILGFPQNLSKGFQRPIHVYTKSTILLSDRVECPQSGSSTRIVYLPAESPSRRRQSMDDSTPTTDNNDNLNGESDYMCLPADSQEVNNESSSNCTADNASKCDHNGNCQCNHNDKSTIKQSAEQTLCESQSFDDNKSFIGDNT